MAKSHETKKKAEALYRNIKDLYSKENLTEEDNKKFDEWNKEFDSLMAHAKSLRTSKKEKSKTQRSEQRLRKT
jgi:hypothetical protein